MVRLDNQRRTIRGSTGALSARYSISYQLITIFPFLHMMTCLPPPKINHNDDLYNMVEMIKVKKGDDNFVSSSLKVLKVVLENFLK